MLQVMSLVHTQRYRRTEVGTMPQVMSLVHTQRYRRTEVGTMLQVMLHTMLQEEEDERQAMNQSYSTLVSSTLKKKSRPMGSKDIQTHVFVWGLNDKDQLGGPKGSKVGPLLCLLLCVCVCVCVHACMCGVGVE